MRKSFALLAVAVLVLGLGVFGSVRSGDAAFHLMRVYGVMGGAGGDANVQYVELRMTDAGQNFVAGHDICFYDATGAAYARYRFPANVTNSADEASILVGTTEFDNSWSGSLGANFTFGDAGNTVAIQGGADVNHPVRTPAGKVAFGTDTATTPSLMCQAGFTPNLIDSVAYGASYAGTVDFPGSPPTGPAADLPTSGTQALRLQGPICIDGSFGSPCASPRENSVNYAVVDVNMAGNNPRNNASQSGPVLPDSDGDTVVNTSDLCPGTAPAATVDGNGCSQAQVDSDADTVCNPGAPSGGPGPCTGTDNCPSWPNPAQNLPLWTVPANDPDCDGFMTAAETFTGTDPNGHCAAIAGSNNEGPPDRWAADFNDDQLATTLDLVSYVTALNASTGNPNYLQRADLNANGTITTLDLVAYVEMLNKSCV